MKAYGITDRGMVRLENQDAFRYMVSDGGQTAVAVLCDGMGGEKNGGLASALAADAFMSYITDGRREPEDTNAATLVREAAAYANLRVYDRACRDASCAGMGTTLVGVLLSEGGGALVNIGDSRAYILTGRVLRQITRDHSLVQEMVARGELTAEEARRHPRRNIITRAAGLEERVKGDVFSLALEEGQALLLCSDGLSNVVPEDVIASVLLCHLEPEPACRELLRLALAAGAPDNVTILILCREGKPDSDR